MGIKDWPGGVIRKTPVTPSGNYSWSSASGVWTPEQVDYWVKQGNWPTPGVYPTYMYLAAKSDNTLYYSLNGTTWTSLGVISGFPYQIYRIEYAAGNIVLFDERLTTRHSRNLGATWSTAQQLGGGVFSYALSIDSTGQYVVVGTDFGAINYSTDYGETYTATTVGSANIYCTIYGNGYFLYGVYNTGQFYRANYNTPGTVTAVGSRGVLGDYGAYDSVANRFWAPGGSSAAGGGYSTNNGTSWTSVTFPTTYAGVAAHNNLLMSIDFSTPLSTSVWRSTNTGGTFTAATPGGTVYSIAQANGLFVVGTSTGVYTSTDGATWTQRVAGDFRCVGAGA